MLHQLLGKGIVLLCIGVALLPFSMYLRDELRTSVGGTPTGEVFVSRSSEAAKRGIALPGEGRPANLVGAQLDRSEKVLVAAGAAIGAGLLMIAISLILRSVNDRSRIGTDKASWVILLGILRRSFGSLIIGALGGVLLIPLKTVPNDAFNVLAALVCVCIVAFVALKRFNVAKLFD